jgi:hypothetical protein
MTNAVYHISDNDRSRGVLLHRSKPWKIGLSFRGAVWIVMTLCCAAFWTWTAVVIARL